jgi:hypothetical protein
MWLIAIMLMSSGLARITGAPTRFPIVWADWLGWLELAVACALFMLAAHVWYMALGGYLFAGFFKIILFLMTGQALYSRTVSLPRLDAAVQAGFALLGLSLLFRFVEIRLTVVDRLALTIYMFTFFQLGNVPVQTLGVGALATSWGTHLFRKQRSRRHCRVAAP